MTMNGIDMAAEMPTIYPETSRRSQAFSPFCGSFGKAVILRAKNVARNDKDPKMMVTIVKKRIVWFD